MAAKRDGSPYRWLCAHVAHVGDDCLPWPFYPGPKGYGMVWFDSKLHRATRTMCILAHGEPPTPFHEAAHSCGNGHEGCCNPNHLSWKTRSENRRDRDIHNRKPKSFRYKLTPAQVAEIRALEGQLTQQKIADRYGISPNTVSQIHKGILWPTGTYTHYGKPYQPNVRPLRTGEQP